MNEAQKEAIYDAIEQCEDAIALGEKHIGREEDEHGYYTKRIERLQKRITQLKEGL